MPAERGRSAGRTRPAALATGACLVLVSCSSDAPSTLDPAGPGARRTADLWWSLFWISTAVVVLVLLGIAWAVVRRRRSAEVRRTDAVRFVVIAGAVVPLVVLTGVYSVSLADLSALNNPPGNDAGKPAVTVDVIGHRWWWEVRYDGTPAVTANEVHIPVDSTVRLRLTTADVVHSFWVPQLMPKTDLITGRVNETWLRADRAGTYRGQCAEYCGLQHGHMAFVVVAEPQDQFDAWLQRLSEAAPQPATAAQQRGLEVFLQSTCAACHSVRGTTAQGTAGPDLSTVGGRWTLGAGVLPNTEDGLRHWIRDPQESKPGSGMPPQPVSGRDLTDLVAYLSSLE